MNPQGLRGLRQMGSEAVKLFGEAVQVVEDFPRGSRRQRCHSHPSGPAGCTAPHVPAEAVGLVGAWDWWGTHETSQVGLERPCVLEFGVAGLAKWEQDVHRRLQEESPDENR